MRIRPIARRRTKRCCRGAASSRASIARSRRASRCRNARGSPMRRSRKCAAPSSMSSRIRRGRWACSCAPSASRGRRLKIGLANLAYNMRRFVWLTAKIRGGMTPMAPRGPSHRKPGPNRPARRVRALQKITSTFHGRKNSVSGGLQVHSALSSSAFLSQRVPAQPEKARCVDLMPARRDQRSGN